MKFTILHTNDIHSRFENFAKIVTKIKEIRDINTLVLDAGDFNDFMRIELQGTEGTAGAELISMAGYDAITVGNNEGFSGIETLENMAASSTVPFLSCNVYRIDNELKEFKELKGVKRSIIVERSGVRFLIIGSSPYSESYNEFFLLSDMSGRDFITEINKELVANDGNYDICILLSHCGMREDKVIAESIKGVDIIINGHSHTLMEEPLKINNTIIHQSGCYGEFLGILEFEYENGIKSFHGENLKIDEVEADADILECLKVNKEKAINNLSKPLYNIEENLWHDVVEENPITNLLADSLKDLLKCDIAIINSGVLNGGIKKGEVSKKKLIEVSPSPLNPTYIEVQGKDIIKALGQSMDTDFCMQDGKGSGFRGKYLGRLHVSGAIIHHDGRSVARVLINNNETGEIEELCPERWYTVATSDYLQRGTGYTSLNNSINEKYHQDYIRDTLRKYLCRNEFVKNAFKDRWVRVESKK